MPESTLKVDVAGWVKRAEDDPVAHLQRQAIEIILNAIAMASAVQ